MPDLFLDEAVEALANSWEREGKLKQERDDARQLARAAWDFIKEGCFDDDVEMGEEGSPERELWIKKWVVIELAAGQEWLNETVSEDAR